MTLFFCKGKNVILNKLQCIQLSLSEIFVGGESEFQETAKIGHDYAFEERGKEQANEGKLLYRNTTGAFLFFFPWFQSTLFKNNWMRHVTQTLHLFEEHEGKGMK